MSTDLECRQTDISDFSIATQLELTDLDADRRLLDLPGTAGRYVVPGKSIHCFIQEDDS